MSEIALEKGASVATITISRPAKLNAMTGAMYGALADAVQEAENDAATRVIVLCAAPGRAFCVGADIGEFEAHRSSRTAALAWSKILHRPIHAMRECVHPVIAAIDGLCVGGGLELAACCDMRLATSRSRFGIPIKKLGLPVDYAELGLLLPLVGPSHALAMVLEGRIFDAAEAERIGLVNRLMPEDGFDASVHEAASTIAEGAPLAARMHKRMVRRLLAHAPLSDTEREEPYALFDTADFREGTAAFLQKRTPEFKGR